MTVYDGRRGVVTTRITVDVSPTNKAPTIDPVVGAPNAAGSRHGQRQGHRPRQGPRHLRAGRRTHQGRRDNHGDRRFHLHPDGRARHAAKKLGATAADKKDTFTIAVNDGHGGVVSLGERDDQPRERRPHRR